jgi:hypothetical protein
MCVARCYGRAWCTRRSVALICQLLGKSSRLCLGDEVADDFGGRLIEVRGQRVKLLPRQVIEPQHEALGIDAGIVGALAWCRRLPAGGEIRDRDLAHPVA